MERGRAKPIGPVNPLQGKSSRWRLARADVEHGRFRRGRMTQQSNDRHRATDTSVDRTVWPS